MTKREIWWGRSRPRSKPPKRPARWDSNDDRDIKAMTDWVLYQLDIQADFDELESMWEEGYEHISREQMAIEAADGGDIEPLRKLHPKLANYLHLPPRRREQGRPKMRVRPPESTDDPALRVLVAAQDVEFIKRLWKREYGRQNRTTAPSAVEIAAKRWDVSAADLRRFKKKHPRVLHRKSRT